MDSTINGIIIDLIKPYGPRQICVFGSYARGEMKATSDIDILIDFKEPIGLLRLGGIYYNLSERLKRKVDIVTKGRIHPLLEPFIKEDLIEIYSG